MAMAEVNEVYMRRVFPRNNGTFLTVGVQFFYFRSKTGPIA